MRCLFTENEHSSQPSAEDCPKVMIKVCGRPILGHIIDYWKNFASEFVFVVGSKDRSVRAYLAGFDIEAKFLVQSKPNGIAAAIGCARNEVPECFTVLLGDCVYGGSFTLGNDIRLGLGVCHSSPGELIRQNYSVLTEGNRVVSVEEKPRTVFNDLCGMGCYFFDSTVFAYIERTKPSSLRNEIEITDVIQMMIEHGEKISAVRFDGWYVNVNDTEDVRRLENILREKASESSSKCFV